MIRLVQYGLFWLPQNRDEKKTKRSAGNDMHPVTFNGLFFRACICRNRRTAAALCPS